MLVFLRSGLVVGTVVSAGTVFEASSLKGAALWRCCVPRVRNVWLSSGLKDRTARRTDSQMALSIPRGSLRADRQYPGQRPHENTASRQETLMVPSARFWGKVPGAGPHV